MRPGYVLSVAGNNGPQWTGHAPCHNQGSKGDSPVAPCLAIAMSVLQRKMLVWILPSVLAASLSYAAFRGYFSTELLLGFANTFSC